MNYRELTAPDLLKLWRSIVNKYTTGGRDLKMLKDALALYTSPQILLGFYQYKGTPTISVPQFLRQYEDWLEEDTVLAEIELCRHLTGDTPPEYLEYMDSQGWESALERTREFESRIKLIQWADKVLA